MPARSRADYFSNYEDIIGQFIVEIEKEKIEALEKLLTERKTNTTRWLSQKIDEELQCGGI